MDPANPLAFWRIFGILLTSLIVFIDFMLDMMGFYGILNGSSWSLGVLKDLPGLFWHLSSIRWDSFRMFWDPMGFLMDPVDALVFWGIFGAFFFTSLIIFIDFMLDLMGFFRESLGSLGLGRFFGSFYGDFWGCRWIDPFKDDLGFLMDYDGSSEGSGWILNGLFTILER